nr:HAD-IIB family hydrolase [uncultured Anaerostipes sp.]
MIQLIVSDLDGTLLNSEQQITERTIRAIKQLQRKGVRLLINTEMNYFDTKQLLDSYDLQCDVACFGGSCIFDASGEQLHASYIPSGRIPDMLRIFGSCRTFYEIHSTNGLCILGSKTGYENYLRNEVIPSIIEENKILNLEPDAYIQHRIEHAHFYDNSRLLLDENPRIIKISTQSPDVDKLNILTDTLHTQVPDFAVSSRSPYRLDVTAVNALKGSAVNFYTSLYDISLRNTMVIGYSENDYSMLGLPHIESVAMGNSADIIKDICLHHTAGNDEDGAAIVFEQVLSKQ